MTANAMSSCQPTNHEWVSSEPVLNSAEPVLPYTGLPGTSARSSPVPLVTTSRIIARSGSTDVAASCGPSAAGAGGAGSRMSLGCLNWPRATAAVAPAIARGLTAVLPWPNAAAASSVGLSAGGDLAAERVGAQVPFGAQAEPRSPPPGGRRRRAWGPALTNAVLHDLAKSVRNGTEPSSISCELWNSWPPTFLVLGQSTAPSRVTIFLSSRPSADTILNVEPGGTWPVIAVLTAAPSGPLVTATTDESLIRIATRALGCFSAATAVSAAFWIVVSRVVLSGLPGIGWVLNSCESSTVPSGVLRAITTDWPGVPRSWAS